MLAAKAAFDDLPGRFREIVSDPLNLLIRRHPLAGTVENNLVVLHNGNRVLLRGSGAYYGAFSDILVINRGVHEPLEEYVFQCVLAKLPPATVMLELGAYWAHYSMWLKQVRPDAVVTMVEPDAQYLECGRANFHRNDLTGEFIHAAASDNAFTVDGFLTSRQLARLTILHADVQGAERDVLRGCARSLQSRLIDFIFISTHSNGLHHDVLAMLAAHNYRIEVSADFDYETTSFDGFVFASSPQQDPVFLDFKPLTRGQIVTATPAQLLQSLREPLQ